MLTRLLPIDETSTFFFYFVTDFVWSLKDVLLFDAEYAILPEGPCNQLNLFHELISEHFYILDRGSWKLWSQW